ncbi:hypothetical protein FD754_016914 [Muntiacus muntjak]|uniref:IZUMO family member 2 n=1 Tax=Muntiacus muntjak TaxID=9888 RepID=A0A5N3VS42_MUNMU|nr:hypothetical protein FD754_016914 [Muntiacus muntjak]
MPLAWALLLLLGLSARRDWGCLQCDHSVREALKQLRLALIPSRFQQGQLQARAQVVLRGMEGPFFRDYALNAFVGRVGMDHLDLVASFVKNQTSNLMANSLRVSDTSTLNSSAGNLLKTKKDILLHNERNLEFILQCIQIYITIPYYHLIINLHSNAIWCGPRLPRFAQMHVDKLHVKCKKKRRRGARVHPSITYQMRKLKPREDGLAWVLAADQKVDVGCSYVMAAKLASESRRAFYN